MPRLGSFLALIALVSLSGCTEVHTNKPLVTYERNSATIPQISTVSQKGLYALFPGDGLMPLDAAYLAPGDQYGFKANGNRVVGVYSQAGQTKMISLDGVLTADYNWKYQGDKQP